MRDNGFFSPSLSRPSLLPSSAFLLYSRLFSHSLALYGSGKRTHDWRRQSNEFQLHTYIVSLHKFSINRQITFVSVTCPFYSSMCSSDPLTVGQKPTVCMWGRCGMSGITLALPVSNNQPTKPLLPSFVPYHATLQSSFATLCPSAGGIL